MSERGKAGRQVVREPGWFENRMAEIVERAERAEDVLTQLVFGELPGEVSTEARERASGRASTGEVLGRLRSQLACRVEEMDAIIGDPEALAAVDAVIEGRAGD